MILLFSITQRNVLKKKFSSISLCKLLYLRQEKIEKIKMYERMYYCATHSYTKL